MHDGARNSLEELMSSIYDQLADAICQTFDTEISGSLTIDANMMRFPFEVEGETTEVCLMAHHNEKQCIYETTVSFSFEDGNGVILDHSASDELLLAKAVQILSELAPMGTLWILERGSKDTARTTVRLRRCDAMKEQEFAHLATGSLPFTLEDSIENLAVEWVRLRGIMRALIDEPLLQKVDLDRVRFFTETDLATVGSA